MSWTHPLRNSLRHLLVGMIAVGALSAHAAELTSSPLPQVEPGMHTASIRRIASDAAGRWAVTASDDKTARVWDLSTGEMLRVLRPPQDGGDEGKLYAVALSPDGATVALGGWSKDNDIYLFDRASGALRRRIGGLPNVIAHLAWSPDGNTLAATSGNGGLRLYHVDGKERARADDCKEISLSAHFRADSRRLVTTCLDGQVRLYELEKDRLRLLAQRAQTAGQRPLSACFSPDGRQIAVGFVDSTMVQVLGADTLAEQTRPFVAGVDNGNLSSVAWSADGRYLYAAGRWDMRGKSMLRRWLTGDWQRYQDSPLSEDTVMNLVPLPNNRLLYAAGDPEWGIVTEDGKIVPRRGRQGANLSGQRDQLQLSPDGRSVRFGYREWGKDPALFDLARRSLVAPGQSLTAARTQAPGIQVENWKSNEHPRLNSQPLTLQDFEVSLSLAIAPDASRFVLGTGWWLRMFDPAGQSLWRQPVPDVAWAVNFSADGRWLVAGYGDGTIRWHRVADGKEVLAFFPHADRKRWVAWTPEGFYDASEGGEELMGYHLNHGRDQAGEFVSASQLREKFYQPGLVARRLDADGDALLAEAVKQLGDVRQLLAEPKARPPLLELASQPVTRSDGETEIVVRLKNPSGGKVRLVYSIDGVEIAGRQGSVAMDGTVSRSFPLAPGRRVISAYAINERGVASAPVQAVVERRAAAAAPSLHLLAVGISDYRDHALHDGVRFAAGDALALKKLFEAQGGKLFSRVNAQVLTDRAASREGIRRAMVQMGAQVRPEDVFVLYLAGHGTSHDGGYYFVPADALYTNAERLRENSLDEATLRELFKGITSSKTLTLLDTCSGGALGKVAGRGLGDKEAIDRLSRLTGRATIAATADGKMALEGEGRHGAFTYTLLEGLSGKAGSNRDGHIEVRDIADYLEKQLPILTSRKWGYEQIPFSRTEGQSFVVLPKP